MLATENPMNTETALDEGSVTVGIVVAERLYAGLVVNDKLSGPILSFPEGGPSEDPDDDDSLIEYHTDALVEAICTLTLKLVGARKGEVTAVGVALPGVMRNGVIEDSPNLPQLKGAHMADLLCQMLGEQGLKAQVVISNDADAIAAGLAGERGKLDRRLRVWTLGIGIGFGAYPFTEGVWEGGHTTVTLDERENYCGCGGRGHVEGIMGHRAMRLRFLDMEPEEVFEAATRKPTPEPRCAEFRELWHRALAAGCATSLHVMGPGKFFFTGFNVRFLDLNLLRRYLHEMVKMSPLQAYQLEIAPNNHLTVVLGAAIAAEQMTQRC